MTSPSKSFGTKKPAKEHLVKPSGGMSGEVWDLRKDIEEMAVTLEDRPVASGYPAVTWIDGGVDSAGADAVLKGRNLLQGQTFASHTVGVSLALYACVPGEAGNDFTVTVTDVGVGGLDVSMVGNDLTINQGGSASDEDTIATAINDSGADTYQKIRANSGGGAAPTAAAQASFTGGDGDGWTCYAAGVAAPIKHTTGGATSVANLTETEATVTVPALAGTATGDWALVEVRSDGKLAQTSGVLL